MQTIRLTVDLVLLKVLDRIPHILFIRRGRPPFEGTWALPGGHVEFGEDLETAAVRELQEETGLDAPSNLVQIGTFGHPKRDPRGHVVSVAFLGILRSDSPEPVANDDAADAAFIALDKLEELELAFDHKFIVDAALSMVHPKGGEFQLAPPWERMDSYVRAAGLFASASSEA